MTFKVKPTKLSGKINATPSKSFSLRAIVASSLCTGVSTIKNVELCDDVKSIILAFKKFGVKFEFNNNTLKVFGGIKNIGLKGFVDCFDCGFNFRVLSFILMTFKNDFYLKGTKNLFKRPLICNISLNGKKFLYLKKFEDLYKIVGRLIPGKYEVDFRISSQFITGLLFSLPLLKKDSKIIFKHKLESEQYVKITLYVLKKFGIKIKKIRNGFKVFGNQKFKETNFVVEADYSKAAFFSVVGALAPIEIYGLNKKSLQQDKKILNIVKKCGAVVKYKKDVLFIAPKKQLKPFKYNVKNTPDIAICLAIFACFCSGVSKIKGVRRLQFKESNRINSILNLINSLGGVASFFEDYIVIKGGKKLKGGFVEGFKDHRVVMAAFFISCFCEDFVYVSDVESVFKSNVSFFEDFKALGGVFYGVCF